MNKKQSGLRIFAVSQGSSLSVFHRMIDHLREFTAIEMVSHYVADSSYYRRFIKKYGPVTSGGEVVTEWDAVARGLMRRPTMDEIAKWERLLGVASLWPVIIADRRMINGKNCKTKQDYMPQYSLEELQGITIQLAEELWNSMERQRPHVVLSFGPATIGAYIAHLVAKAKGIVSLNLKSTKVANYVTLSTDVMERHEHIRRQYEEYRKIGLDDNDHHIASAQKYLSAVANNKIVYEGSLLHNEDPTIATSLGYFIIRIPVTLAIYAHSLLDTNVHDPQRQPILRSAWNREVGKSYRISMAKRVLQNRFVNPEELPNIKYVFVPLNSEPEISLSVYSRFTLNQIEVVRNIAQAVPLGTQVLIKEHPRSWGLRSTNYYRRLCEIPNVKFAPIETPTSILNRHACATVVVSSFVGYEAIMQGVPVVVLGNCSYDMLPETMVRRVAAHEDLPLALSEVMKNYAKDDNAIICYLAAVMKESVRLDLYSKMLNKGKREAGTGTEKGVSLEKQYNDFANYFMRRVAEESSVMPR